MCSIISVFLLQSEHLFKWAIFCPFSYALGGAWFCFALPIWRVKRKEKTIFVIDWAVTTTWSLMCGLKIEFVLWPKCIEEFLLELAILSVSHSSAFKMLVYTGNISIFPARKCHSELDFFFVKLCKQNVSEAHFLPSGTDHKEHKFSEHVF